MISPNNRDRHRTGKDVSGGMGGKNNAAWSESKPSGIDGLGPRLTNENRHPSVQVVRGSTNMDLSRGMYWMTIQVDSHLLLTSKQRLRLSTWASY